MSLILPAIQFTQRNLKMYIASIPVNELEHLSIDIWNPKNIVGKRGYQRQPDDKRINNIAKYFERQKTIMPVAGLVNVREKGRLKFKDGKLIIPDGIKIWVVDMQHRLKGLVRAHERKLISGANFQFPVVITEGLSQVDEAAQFYIINTKAKKMDVALTRRLLIENENAKLLSDVKPWEIAAVRTTIEINQRIRQNPWFGVIRQPNEESSKRFIATEKSFVSSLRQLYIARHGNPLRMSKRLAYFWNVIQELIPEAFEDPRRYLIQRTAGMFTFNFFIAPEYLAKYKDKDLKKRLVGIEKIGSEFWKRSEKRGARRFGTGMGGYANLAQYVRERL